MHANSPQAKGRVERANQTLQDRLVKEMRLLGLNDQASANAWLPTFMANFNRRFAVKPTQSSDAHVLYQGKTHTLRRILSKNLSCQHEKTLLQVKTEGQGLSLRGAKVVVHRHSDGSIELLWRGRALAFEQSVKPPKQHATVDAKEVNARVDWTLKKRAGTVPAKNHPWKKVRKGAFDATPVIAQFHHSKDPMCAQAASA